MEYLHRIDPRMTQEGARRILESLKQDLSKLRPKARKHTEEKIAMIERDMQKLPN